jgi:hypothetical protein
MVRWKAFDESIAEFDSEFASEAKRDEAAHRLTSIPGTVPSMRLSGRGSPHATAILSACRRRSAHSPAKQAGAQRLRAVAQGWRRSALQQVGSRLRHTRRDGSLGEAAPDP